MAADAAARRVDGYGTALLRVIDTRIMTGQAHLLIVLQVCRGVCMRIVAGNTGEAVTAFAVAGANFDGVGLKSRRIHGVQTIE